MGTLVYIAIGIVLIGWVWNIVTAFKMGGTLWGILNIFLQPFVGIVSAILKKTSWIPVGVMLLGLLLFLLGGGAATMTY
ncbi:MAG: hypothetical protein PSX80_01340 [bacterium]|nr:hypothetical protein [bacterium]